MPEFSKDSLDRLHGVDDRIVQVCLRVVAKHCDCAIVYGLRTIEQQKQLFDTGFSKTMNSRHLVGMAVDIVPYPIDWKNKKRFYYLAGVMLAVAKEMGIDLRWGGDWDMDDNLDDQTFMDLAHFEIPA